MTTSPSLTSSWALFVILNSFRPKAHPINCTRTPTISEVNERILSREDSIKKAESDSVVNVIREAVIEQLYLKWGPKKKTTVDTVKN